MDEEKGKLGRGRRNAGITAAEMTQRKQKRVSVFDLLLVVLKIHEQTTGNCTERRKLKRSRVFLVFDFFFFFLNHFLNAETAFRR